MFPLGITPVRVASAGIGDVVADTSGPILCLSLYPCPLPFTSAVLPIKESLSSFFEVELRHVTCFGQ